MSSNNWASGNLLEDTEPLGHDVSSIEESNSSQPSLVPPLRRPPPMRPSPVIIPDPGNNRLVLAVDYGTTFTGVAFATANGGEVDLSRIEVVQDWTTKMSNQQKVRSVISYAQPVEGEAQWGSDISSDAISMVNTKLELEPQETRFDELDLTLQALRGMGNLTFDHIRRAGPEPEYTCRLPGEIVEDYLTKVAECAFRELNIEQLKRTNTPVDIVATIPVGWSYHAFDTLFKALRGAGFNKRTFPTLQDTILVSEPEAASYFTARDHRDRGSDFLREGECFVLCDAGGGTVDVVSFQVNKVKPQLLLEKATKPTGGKCGSSLIDVAFKGWLRNVIGRDHYAEIDPTNARQRRISPHAGETGVMRHLINEFNFKKAIFSTKTTFEIKLDLPAPLNTLTIEGRVKEGELTIQVDEMRELMDTCVSDVVELIMTQVNEVSAKKQRRVRNVFLVGGFGASPYLQEQLQSSLVKRKMKMRRPDTDKSLTAVVQGAVIYGVEKARHKDVKFMSAITRSYGIVRDTDHGMVFEWLVRRGALVLSNHEHEIRSSNFYHPFRPGVAMKVGYPARSLQNSEFKLYMYNPQEDEEDDNVPERWENGQHEVEVVGTVTCDLSNYVAPDGRAHPNSIVPGTVEALSRNNIGPLSWQLSLSAQGVEAKIMLKDTPLGNCNIKIDLDCPTSDTSSLSDWHDAEDDD